MSDFILYQKRYELLLPFLTYETKELKLLKYIPPWIFQKLFIHSDLYIYEDNFHKTNLTGNASIDMMLKNKKEKDTNLNINGSKLDSIYNFNDIFSSKNKRMGVYQDIKMRPSLKELEDADENTMYAKPLLSDVNELEQSIDGQTKKEIDTTDSSFSNIIRSGESSSDNIRRNRDLSNINISNTSELKEYPLINKEWMNENKYNYSFLFTIFKNEKLREKRVFKKTYIYNKLWFYLCTYKYINIIHILKAQYNLRTIELVADVLNVSSHYESLEDFVRYIVKHEIYTLLNKNIHCDTKIKVTKLLDNITTLLCLQNFNVATIIDKHLCLCFDQLLKSEKEFLEEVNQLMMTAGEELLGQYMIQKNYFEKEMANCIFSSIPNNIKNEKIEENERNEIRRRDEIRRNDIRRDETRGRSEFGRSEFGRSEIGRGETRAGDEYRSENIRYENKDTWYNDEPYNRTKSSRTEMFNPAYSNSIVDNTDNFRDNTDNFRDNTDNFRNNTNNFRNNIDNFRNNTDNFRDNTDNFRNNIIIDENENEENKKILVTLNKIKDYVYVYVDNMIDQLIKTTAKDLNGNVRFLFYLIHDEIDGKNKNLTNKKKYSIHTLTLCLDLYINCILYPYIYYVHEQNIQTSTISNNNNLYKKMLLIFSQILREISIYIFQIYNLGMYSDDVNIFVNNIKNNTLLQNQPNNTNMFFLGVSQKLFKWIIKIIEAPRYHSSVIFNFPEHVECSFEKIVKEIVSIDKASKEKCDNDNVDYNIVFRTKNFTDILALSYSLIRDIY